MQRTRIERLYNRTRAIFAESIVVALLPGAIVIEDPGCRLGRELAAIAPLPTDPHPGQVFR
jgi:hypothetical protein